MPGWWLQLKALNGEKVFMSSTEMYTDCSFVYYIIIHMCFYYNGILEHDGTIVFW